jgi:hypothetical protein
LHLGSPYKRLERCNLRFKSGASTLRNGVLSLQQARRSTADCNWFKSVMRRSKSWSITELGELSCWHESLSSSTVWVIPKPVGSGVLGRASHFRLLSSSSPSFSSCFCLAICSPSPSSTLSNYCRIIIQILLILLLSDSSPHLHHNNPTWRLIASFLAMMPSSTRTFLMWVASENWVLCSWVWSLLGAGKVDDDDIVDNGCWDPDYEVEWEVGLKGSAESRKARSILFLTHQ